MIDTNDDQQRGARTVMGRLRHDVRGNTLAIMAIALIPICALVGSGIDTARLYVVKVRLQQACDAGVLAGRKAMVSSASPTLDSNAADQATKFFNNNFKETWMRTNTVSFTPSKTTDQQVSGTASANVPMTIMKMFSAADVTLNVTCQARYDVADTDIMFVLDTTGSMACLASQGSSCVSSANSYTRENGSTGYSVPEVASSKISAVRSAVLNFYDTVKASADSTTHIRYGFVPYTAAVNAGRAVYNLNSSYLVTNWNYNTRVPAPQTSDTIYNTSTSNTDNVASASCTTGAVRTPTNGYNVSGTNALATLKTTTWTSQTGTKSPGTCTVRTDQLKVTWTYKNAQWPVSSLIAGNAVADPTRFGSSQLRWQGCIEERDTTFNTTTWDINNLPPDLDPDLVPSNDNTRWRPAWPEVSYFRGSATTWNDAGPSGSASSDSTASGQSAGAWVNNLTNVTQNLAPCGKAVSRLQEMTRSEVADFVDNSGDFRPMGKTYHDTGMIWGTRMISPNGIFAADTAAWPGRNPPNRYIVFMTDGDMDTDWNAYSAYGMEYYDRRVTGTNNDEANHNSRFLAECAAAKARNIKVFVIGFGQTLTTQLTTCASPGKAYYASDNTSLEAAFQDIAKQVALLRISQ